MKKLNQDWTQALAEKSSTIIVTSDIVAMFAAVKTNCKRKDDSGSNLLFVFCFFILWLWFEKRSIRSTISEGISLHWLLSRDPDPTTPGHATWHTGRDGRLPATCNWGRSTRTKSSKVQHPPPPKAGGYVIWAVVDFARSNGQWCPNSMEANFKARENENERKRARSLSLSLSLVSLSLSLSLSPVSLSPVSLSPASLSLCLRLSLSLSLSLSLTLPPLPSPPFPPSLPHARERETEKERERERERER